MSVFGLVQELILSFYALYKSISFLRNLIFEIFMDAEFFDTIHLENVKPDGYADLEIILRSDGKLETSGSAKFKVNKGESGKSAFAGR